MKKLVTFGVFLIAFSFQLHAQVDAPLPKKWGVEINVLWPVFPGNMYKGQVTYETWRKKDLAGDVFVGYHIRPFEFREQEGDFANYALTFGYRQYVWKGLHLEFYNAFGPGFNRNNAVNGNNYTSWDYEVGLLTGYRWDLMKPEKRANARFHPYLSVQHGFYYVAAKSNPHPIGEADGERAVYVGILNFGLRF
jgi:hypothetical protein